MPWGLLMVVMGLVSGAFAALALWLMQHAEHLIWQHADGPLQIFLIVLLGGCLIALIRRAAPEASMRVVEPTADGPVQHQQRMVLAVAASAVVAVAFGGAVGPEAGLLALVAELSALLTVKVTAVRAKQQALEQAALTGALAGWYGSPPGALAQIQAESTLPKPALLLAAVAGLLGFAWTAKHVLGGFEALTLPAHRPPGDGSDLLWSLVPAAAGVAMGLLFVKGLPLLKSALARCGGQTRQTLIGSALFGVLAATWPVLRFSGHHDLVALTQNMGEQGAATLLAWALLKVLAVALCLASGWLGGAIFPLLLAGSCVGLSCMALLPGLPPAVAMAAGMAGAATVGLGKPLAAVLILVFLAGPQTLPAVCVGAALGWLASQRWPSTALH